MTTTYPTASVVSRALRRDVSIIATPRTRSGYHVSGGYGAPSISVDVHDSEAANIRHARELVDNLHDVYGWGVDRAVNSSIIYVTRVPSKQSAAMAESRYQAREDALTERRIAAAEHASSAFWAAKTPDYDAIDKILAEGTPTPDGGLVL